jgi:Protein of unknown function (Gmx_para_CXXCG)
VQFYELDQNPRGRADTCFAAEEGHNQGEAERCAACGDFNSMLKWLPPYQVELDLYGSQFGDLVFGPGDSLLVSQRFRQAYYEHGIRSLEGFDPVEVGLIRFKKRLSVLPEQPMYFRVAAMRGNAALDWTASGFEWVRPPNCPECQSGNIKSWQRLVLETGTWSGEDIFRPRRLEGRLMVTQRFKEACERHGITNAVFTPAEEAGHDFYAVTE